MQCFTFFHGARQPYMTAHAVVRDPDGDVGANALLLPLHIASLATCVKGSSYAAHEQDSHTLRCGMLSEEPL